MDSLDKFRILESDGGVAHHVDVDPGNSEYRVIYKIFLKYTASVLRPSPQKNGPSSLDNV
jgi:hypothetical protein